MKTKIELDVDIPEGYEATGEYRKPNSGEFYCPLSGGSVFQEDKPANELCRVVILRKKPITGQAWVDSLPVGALFVHDGSYVYGKLANGEVYALGSESTRMSDLWSDATCKILYRPDESK